VQGPERSLKTGQKIDNSSTRSYHFGLPFLKYRGKKGSHVEGEGCSGSRFEEVARD
jgi:hypothetical protein